MSRLSWHWRERWLGIWWGGGGGYRDRERTIGGKGIKVANLPVSPLMFKKFKEKVTKQIKERGKKTISKEK